MSLDTTRHYIVEPFKADGDLSAKEGYFTKKGANDEDVAVATVAGADSHGMIIDGATDGKAISVLRDGVEQAKVASATYTFMEPLMTGTDGKLLAATAGKYVVAKSRETRSVASADDLLVEVCRTPYTLHA